MSPSAAQNSHDNGQRHRADERVRIGARGVSKSYGQVTANSNVSFSVFDKQIHAVVGENGAGKSTLMRILQGLEKPDNGTVIVDDKSVQFQNPRQAITAGIGMVHQEFMLAPELSLLENLVLGDEPVNKAFGLIPKIDWQKALAEAQALEAGAGIEIEWHRQTSTAPVHIQQYVEIFRLLRRGSNILILDEPTAVLAPQQVDLLFGLLKTLRYQGACIIFISHKLREVAALADFVTIIRKGKVVASRSIEEMDQPTMTQFIMGEGNSEKENSEIESHQIAFTSPAIVLKVEKLNCASVGHSHLISDIGFTANGGEILGLAGIAGNGQEELMECLAGLRSISSGSICVDGFELGNQGNKVFRSHGIGYVSPDRAHEGLARQATIETNVIAASQWNESLVYGPFRRLGKTRKEAGGRLSNLDVRYGKISDPVSSLSGGNQQKLVFAREMATTPKLMIVSQPTRGVDLNGISAIHSFLRGHRDQGGTVVLASEEIDELMELCDRILVMSNGRIVGEVERENFSRTTIGSLMLSSAEDGEAVHG